jgi:hypothetical protein
VNDRARISNDEMRRRLPSSFVLRHSFDIRAWAFVIPRSAPHPIPLRVARGEGTKQACLGVCPAAIEPGGFAAISRWLSAATPPGAEHKSRSHPGGVPEQLADRLPAPLPGCDLSAWFPFRWCSALSGLDHRLIARNPPGSQTLDGNIARRRYRRAADPDNSLSGSRSDDRTWLRTQPATLPSIAFGERTTSCPCQPACFRCRGCRGQSCEDADKRRR